MKIKKILVTMVAALLLMTVTVMGTLAYLTSTTEQVSNTFSVGNVTITLDEAKVDADGQIIVGEGADRVQANSYKLFPGIDYDKDPTVHVAAKSEPCYLFVKVVGLDNIKNIEVKGITDKPTVAQQIATNGWKALPDVDNVYYYQAIVDATNATKNVDKVVFTNVYIDSALTYAQIKEANGKKLYVKAFAIQEDGFNAADAAAVTDTEARAAWDAFIGQNSTAAEIDTTK